MRYVALLAAVNVGKRQMNMARLRQVIAALGYSDVGTYIQTGNLFFEVLGATPAAAVQVAIEQAMAAEFGFAVDTVLLELDEFARIVEHAPFAPRELGPAERRLVLFLRQPAADLPALPVTSANGSFTVVAADADALYVEIADAQAWARTPPAETKRLLGPVKTTGRWHHTSLKILAAARTG